MTAREIQLAKKILDVLHGRTNQTSAMLVHAEVELLLEETVPAAEFSAVFQLCDRRGWLTGITSGTTGLRRWKINDAGEAARLELA
jgi:hypothetical protein